MDKHDVTSNDVLDALSIRLNDTIRPNRNKDKKSNAYYWIFKFTFLILYVIILHIVFNEIREFGVFLIYEVANSLRSVLSLLWVTIISLMKSLVILYLLYSQFKIFTSSVYYKRLYKEEKTLLKNKKKVVHVIETIFKVIAIVYLVFFAILAALSFLGFVYVICMLFDEMYILSVGLVFLTISLICLLMFRHIRCKFIKDTEGVNKKYIIALFVALVASVGFFVYETSSFDHSDTLPVGFKTEEKQVVFNLEENQKVYIKSDSKLDNITIIEDNELKNQIKVELSYYKTADVRYVSTFNDNNDLRLTFTSDLLLDKVDALDIMKLFTSTISNRNIYNYNLFKYPNIIVYANKADMNRIKIK